MNYLSHYYLEYGDSNPYYTFGLIFPDLGRNYNNSWKIRKGTFGGHQDEPEFKSITSGILRHFEMDKLFHNSEFFKQYTDLIGEVLKSYAIGSIDKYRYFFNHVMLELMLDRLIIKENPEVCEKFYRDLEQVDNKTVSIYLKSLNFTNGLVGFAEYFDRFRKHKYLFEYTDNQHLIFALTRVYSRVRDTQHSKEEISKLEKCIEEIEKALSKDYTSIFQELVA